ncbi:MAG: hypothetical protein ACTH30_10575 [Leucobacter sp.]
MITNKTERTLAALVAALVLALGVSAFVPTAQAEPLQGGGYCVGGSSYKGGFKSNVFGDCTRGEQPKVCDTVTSEARIAKLEDALRRVPGNAMIQSSLRESISTALVPLITTGTFRSSTVTMEGVNVELDSKKARTAACKGGSLLSAVTYTAELRTQLDYKRYEMSPWATYGYITTSVSGSLDGGSESATSSLQVLAGQGTDADAARIRDSFTKFDEALVIRELSSLIAPSVGNH